MLPKFNFTWNPYTPRNRKASSVPVSNAVHTNFYAPWATIMVTATNFPREISSCDDSSVTQTEAQKRSQQTGKVNGRRISNAIVVLAAHLATLTGRKDEQFVNKWRQLFSSCEPHKSPPGGSSVVCVCKIGRTLDIRDFWKFALLRKEMSFQNTKTPDRLGVSSLPPAQFCGVWLYGPSFVLPKIDTEWLMCASRWQFAIGYLKIVVSHSITFGIYVSSRQRRSISRVIKLLFWPY